MWRSMRSMRWPRCAEPQARPERRLSMEATEREGPCFPVPQVGDVEADQLGRRGQGLGTAHPAPARDVGPVPGAGPQGGL